MISDHFYSNIFAAIKPQHDSNPDVARKAGRCHHPAAVSGAREQAAGGDGVGNVRDSRKRQDCPTSGEAANGPKCGLPEHSRQANEKERELRERQREDREERQQQQPQSTGPKQLDVEQETQNGKLDNMLG